MENKKEMTAPNVSVGADTEQPIQKIAENSIYEYEENIKSFEEMQREMQLSFNCIFKFHPYMEFNLTNSPSLNSGI